MIVWASGQGLRSGYWVLRRVDTRQAHTVPPELAGGTGESICPSAGQPGRRYYILQMFLTFNSAVPFLRTCPEIITEDLGESWLGRHSAEQRRTMGGSIRAGKPSAALARVG